MFPLKRPKRLMGAVVGSLLAGTTGQAQAATITSTYDFTLATTGYSSTKTFTSLLGPSLTVSANTVSTDGNAVTAVTGSGVGIGQWTGYGLGISNSPTDNSHTIDGYGLNDLLTLTFASSVRVISATFNYAGYLTSSDDDFAYFASPNDDGSVAGDMIFSSRDIAITKGKADGAGGPYSGGKYDFTADLFGGDFASKVFGIGAIWDDAVCKTTERGRTCTNRFDSFKLASITVAFERNETIPQVPLPAGAVLLLSGLACLGFLGRAKRFTGKI